MSTCYGLKYGPSDWRRKFAIRGAPNVDYVQSAENQQRLRSLYKPLKAGQMRLIRLNEASDGPLTARLVVLDLRQADGPEREAYHALSYVCGSQTATEFIEVDGTMILITKDLATILRCIQSAEASIRHLWVGTICVNQEDDLERASQALGVMEIFSKAYSVLAWMGEADMDGLQALFQLRDHNRVGKQLKKIAAGEHACEDCEPRIKAMHDALTRFCERPWFRRLWIRSEVFGAQRLRCMIYSEQNDNRRFIYDSFMVVDTHTQLIPMLESLEKCRAMFTPPSRFSLDPLLEVFRSFKWSLRPSQPGNFPSLLSRRPRELGVKSDVDAVYALLTICAVPAHAGPPYDSHPDYADDATPPISVDYTRSPSQVFTDATLHILAKRSSPSDLANLWNHHEPLPPSSSSHHPRWIPNFRHPSPILPKSADLEPFLAFPSRSDDGDIPPESFPWPRIHRSPAPTSPYVPVSPPHLRLEIRATNYIAHLTPFTFPHDLFLETPSVDLPFQLSPQGRAIHSSRKEPASPFPSPFHPFLSATKEPRVLFDPAEGHRRRIAVLGVGVGGEEGLALVPAEARVGDLVVAVAEGVLPIVISPRARGLEGQGEGTAGGMIDWEKVGEEEQEGTTGWRERAGGIVRPVRGGVREGLKMGKGLMRKVGRGAVGRVWSGMRRHSNTILFWFLLIEPCLIYYQVISILKDWSVAGKVMMYLPPFVPVLLPLIYYIAVELKGCLTIEWVETRARDVELPRVSRRSALDAAIEKRREVVGTYLDQVKERVGEEWDFVGPVFVRHTGDRMKVTKRPAQMIALY